MRHLVLVLVLLVPPLAMADAGEKLVASDSHGGSDGALSPAGKWIVCSSSRNGEKNIWIVEVAGWPANRLYLDNRALPVR